MTLDEQLAVLIAHNNAIAECSNFEAFKLQQIAYIEMLIGDFQSVISKRDFVNGEHLKPENIARALLTPAGQKEPANG